MKKLSLFIITILISTVLEAQSATHIENSSSGQIYVRLAMTTTGDCTVSSIETFCLAPGDIITHTSATEIPFGFRAFPSLGCLPIDWTDETRRSNVCEDITCAGSSTGSLNAVWNCNYSGVPDYGIKIW